MDPLPEVDLLRPLLVLKMPSMDRVIFYLGDEVVGEAGAKKIVSIRVPEGGDRASAEGLEGLRIVIRNGEKRSNATSMLIRQPELGFLKSCCLCRRELNPCKDVYMYRGDQGFCSDECRSRQILLDERRELEATTARDRVLKAHRPRRRHRRHSETPDKITQSDLNRRISAAV